MKRFRGELALGAVLAGGCALLAGCTVGAPAPLAAEPASAAEASGPHYSPWVVEVEAAYADMSTFDVISFKDVGMSLPEEDSDSVYRTIASALAEDLSSGGEMMSRVSYSAEQADPSHHLACGARQIYIDLWESAGPDRLGYSLWSGCSEQDQFAWTEVPAPDGGDRVDALTTSIAGDIRAAMRRGCFTRSC